MNSLWLLVGFFIIIVGVCLILVLFHLSKNRSSDNLCQNNGLSELIDITNEPCCCSKTYSNQSKFLIQNNMLVAPFDSVSYLAVCSGYCDSLIDGVCTSATNPQAQNDYNSCISLLEPTNCVGVSKPVAYSNDIIYFAQEIGNSQCSVTYDCSNPSICSNL